MATVTVPATAACDLLFVTNVDPDLNCAYQESGEAMPHSYTRANSGRTVVQLIEGRDGPIAFRATEGRSDVFERTLVVEIDITGASVTNIDRVAFDPLLALIEEPTLTPVVVLDGHGRRWFATVDFLSGTYTYTGHEAQTVVRVTEVDGGPFPVTTATPWT